MVFYQFPVVATEGEELVVCALFADLAIFDEYDAVSIHHGAEAVSRKLMLPSCGAAIC